MTCDRVSLAEEKIKYKFNTTGLKMLLILRLLNRLKN